MFWTVSRCPIMVWDCKTCPSQSLSLRGFAQAAVLAGLMEVPAAEQPRAQSRALKLFLLRVRISCCCSVVLTTVDSFRARLSTVHFLT